MATKYLFFWGHTPKKPGMVGAECLSQWYPASFEVGGVRFATAEHYMMWGKARLFGDEETAAKVVDVGHPQEAKALGRTIAGFDEDTWVANRLAIVTAANVAKFRQNPELLAFLLGTGTRVLVEASPVDRIWGIGLAATDERVHDPAKWKGLNLLGEALMAARVVLAAEAEVEAVTEVEMESAAAEAAGTAGEPEV
ncbi:NADAR family protein [Catenulispora pinisilvae]|uniref:NADAR family protein n=1 Tax=Catenulispora pinisilvae TaxID=2705253 RepID=UPI0018927495|nr:NADAR family protein [Catenulispora pinisilvae]